MNRTFVIKKDKIFFIIIFTLIITVTGIDIVKDLSEGLPLSHVIHEMGIATLCLIFIIYQLKLSIIKTNKLSDIQKNAALISEENSALKRQLQKLSGEFYQIVNLQMDEWKFSNGEKDIGKLIMKGLSMKEIAEIRDTSESTVRQQATTLYRKANVHSRQEFIAYFLEDL